MAEITNAETVDPRYDAENTDPFAPIEDNSLPIPTPDEWDTLPVIHEGVAETEKYVLEENDWEYIDTDTEEIELHQVGWEANIGVPGVTDSTQTRVLIEYNENTIHFEAGEPVEMAPGYTVVCLTADSDDELVEELVLGTFRNLAAALKITDMFLNRVAAGGNIDWKPPETPDINDVVESLGMPSLPS